MTKSLLIAALFASAASLSFAQTPAATPATPAMPAKPAMTAAAPMMAATPATPAAAASKPMHAKKHDKKHDKKHAATASKDGSGAAPAAKAVKPSASAAK